MRGNILGNSGVNEGVIKSSTGAALDPVEHDTVQDGLDLSSAG